MLKRMTPQKKIVYEALESLGHASVETLISYIQRNYHKIALSTIYRNIQSLLVENKIRLVKLRDEDVLESIKEDHAHFICECCGKIMDMSMDKEKVLVEAISHSSHLIRQCEVSFYGICKNCKKEKEKKNEVCM